jgi:hypothetical protein
MQGRARQRSGERYSSAPRPRRGGAAWLPLAGILAALPGSAAADRHAAFSARGVSGHRLITALPQLPPVRDPGSEARPSPHRPAPTSPGRGSVRAPGTPVDAPRWLPAGSPLRTGGSEVTAVQQTALARTDRLAEAVVNRCVRTTAALQYSERGPLRVLLFTDRKTPAWVGAAAPARLAPAALDWLPPEPAGRDGSLLASPTAEVGFGNGIEMRYRVVGDTGPTVDAAAFAAPGQLLATRSDLDVFGLPWALGLGLRYEGTPLGPLRLDVGHRRSEVAGPAAWEIHLVLGYAP